VPPPSPEHAGTMQARTTHIIDDARICRTFPARAKWRSRVRLREVGFSVGRDQRRRRCVADEKYHRGRRAVRKRSNTRAAIKNPSYASAEDLPSTVCVTFDDDIEYMDRDGVRAIARRVTCDPIQRSPTSAPTRGYDQSVAHGWPTIVLLCTGRHLGALVLNGTYGPIITVGSNTSEVGWDVQPQLSVAGGLVCCAALHRFACRRIQS